MNAPQKSRQFRDDDARFDRLVDGELTQDEYRSLLASLDDEPAGWRRCALAFLEAQALGQECAHDFTREVAGIRGDLPPAAAVRSASLASTGKLCLAMAASLLVAFALGALLPRYGQPVAVPAPGSNVAATIPREPVQADPTHWPPQSVARARLMFDGANGAQSAAGELPIYEVSGTANEWLGTSEPALPVALINELERRGHRVQRHQQYVPVDLEDGRRGVIPVEGYQITPVSRRAY